MDRLIGVRTKVERARYHARELDAALVAFLGTEPYQYAIKRDPATQRLIYYLVRANDVPTDLGVIAGEVFQSLRSALDHLAYQLVLAGTGQSGPFLHVYFPIFDTAKKYREGKMGYVRGMVPSAINAIDAIKPFKGGNDPLWQLHKLNIVDKHRLLITVGAGLRSIDVGTHMTSQMRFADGTPVPILPVFVELADPMFPLKVGDEIGFDTPDADPNNVMPIRSMWRSASPASLNINRWPTRYIY